MSGNLLLGFISLVLALSPYITKFGAINDYLQLRSVGNIQGSFEIFVVALGAIGLALSFYNMFLKKKNGAPYILIGALILVVGFFYNEEKIPLPLNNALMGGELFFAAVVSFFLALTGLVVEWLVEQPH
jgi:intracellular septation protein A